MDHINKQLALTRSVNAVQIPNGDKIKLPKGTKVIITQKLGGSFTLSSELGLARITEKDSDCLGLDKINENNPQNKAEKLEAQGKLKEAVWEQLRQVYDPEIPISIVDLGLIYDCIITEKKQTADVKIKMTLTAPGCGMGPVIAADAQNKVLALKKVTDANVELVWEPPWHQDMISKEGKMKLGLI